LDRFFAVRQASFPRERKRFTSSFSTSHNPLHSDSSLVVALLVERIRFDIRSPFWKGYLPLCSVAIRHTETKTLSRTPTRGHLRKVHSMTSVSQQSQNPSQASNSSSASQSTVSYANAAKAVSSPPIATGSSTPSPAVAVGGSAPVQHGKSSSISPVNGRPSIPPAVPAVSAPAIAHSNSAANGSATDHSRKSLVTISATGPNGYVNGGPVGGSKSGIQFGSITDSPAASHSTPQVAQPAASAPISIPRNPRVTSPAQSPSPIPPSASGGRPPSVSAGQGNGVTFGSLGDGDVSLRLFLLVHIILLITYV
jgi:hypothetical protein